MRAAVVGGGIAGLSAAWALSSDPAVTEVTLYEPGHLGGMLVTSPFCGLPVDEGPDAFITRTPDAVELCHELEMTSDLVAPAAGSTLVWRRGRLHPLPTGLVLGVPRALGGVMRSSLLGPLGRLRAAADLVLPPSPTGDDISVWELVAARFGPAVARELVDPLVGGIHAGRTEDLSAAATAPQILAATRHHRSMLRGLHTLTGSTAAGISEPASPLFLAPRRGMEQIARRLVAALTERGVALERQAVTRVRRAGGQGLAVEGPDAVVDRVVLAVGAPDAARVLGTASPSHLGATPAASVAVVTLAFGAADLSLPPGVNGVLVPRVEGKLMTACSFGSNKWPHWARPGQVVLRVSAGRAGDERVGTLGDEELVGRLVEEVGAALPCRGAPTAWRVTRWPSSFPQYLVGHLRSVAEVEGELERSLPGVALAGSWYRGAGIPACIASGRRAAARVAGPDT